MRALFPKAMLIKHWYHIYSTVVLNLCCWSRKCTTGKKSCGWSFLSDQLYGWYKQRQAINSYPCLIKRINEQRIKYVIILSLYKSKWLNRVQGFEYRHHRLLSPLANFKTLFNKMFKIQKKKENQLKHLKYNVIGNEKGILKGDSWSVGGVHNLIEASGSYNIMWVPFKQGSVRSGHQSYENLVSSQWTLKTWGMVVGPAKMVKVIPPLNPPSSWHQCQIKNPVKVWWVELPHPFVTWSTIRPSFPTHQYWSSDFQTLLVYQRWSHYSPWVLLIILLI